MSHFAWCWTRLCSARKRYHNVVIWWYAPDLHRKETRVPRRNIERFRDGKRAWYGTNTQKIHQSQPDFKILSKTDARYSRNSVSGTRPWRCNGAQLDSWLWNTNVLQGTPIQHLKALEDRRYMLYNMQSLNYETQFIIYWIAVSLYVNIAQRVWRRRYTLTTKYSSAAAYLLHGASII